MKKALSIIMCLAMLMSTVPMSVFAAPQAVTTEDSAFEIVTGEAPKNDDSAELAEETEILITYDEGYRSKLKDGKSHFASKAITKGEEFTIGKLNKPESRYESTVAGYVLDGNWTDGTDIYAPGSSFVPEADINLVPNVVPEGDGYEVTFSVDPIFAGSYSGPGRLFMAVGEELDLTSEMFTLAPVESCPIICWKNAATGEVVTSVSGAKDEVIELVVASNAKELVITLTSASEIVDNSGSLELAATVEAADGSEVVNTLTWAITGGDEGIATLEGNVLTAIWDGTVEVAAIPDYDNTQAKVFEIVISGQVGYTVKYDKNTGADVEVPSDEKTKGKYTVSNYTPVREGYYFGGWMLDPYAENTVGATLDVKSDVTLYAMWTKGGFITTFTEEGSRVNSEGSTVILADGNYLAIDKRFASELEINTEDGYVGMTLGGTESPRDHRIQLDMNSPVDISGSDKIVIGFRTDIAGTIAHNFYYATMDANGDWIAPSNSAGNCINPEIASDGAAYVANYFSSGLAVSVSGDINQVYELVIDMSNREPWDGYLDHIRLGITNASFAGKKIYYEYIKIEGAKTIEEIELSIDAPVAAELAYGLEAVSAGSDKYVATGIAWEGSELIRGKFFDSEKAYTAKVEIEASGAYALSDAPHTVTVNGEEAKVVVEGDKIFVVYEFGATENVGELIPVNVTLNVANDDGATTETGVVFANRDFDLANLIPENIPFGMRWIGWSETDGGEIISDVINIAEETEYFAHYEAIKEYDFSNKYHKNATNVKATDGIVSFDGAWTVVTPKSNDVSALLILDGMYVASGVYDFVEVIYDGSLEDANNANKFNEAATPALRVYGTDSDSYEAAVVKAEPVIVSNRVAYKYTYDISANGKPAVITAFELAPYKGRPAWAVASVKLIENTSIEKAVAITGIKAPETWFLPDVSAEASENYEIVSIAWDSENGFNNDGSFISETEYTATFVVRPAVGYRICVEEATIDGAEADSAVLGDDGLLTITKTYPATEALVEFTLEVADAQITDVDGTVKLVPVFTPANEGEVIENKAVTWEIVDNGPEGKSAAIDQNGVVKAYFDGTVVVRATSKYNPEIYVEATVTITNQVEFYTVTFDANTNSEAVTNMPEDANAKLDYVLPADAPVRHGFKFAGWAKAPGDKVTIARDVVTGDTTYYAVWVQGFNLEFISENDKVTSVDNTGNLVYDLENGALRFTPIASRYGSVDMQIKIGRTGGEPLFKGGDFKKLEIRVKGEKASNTVHTLFFTSQRADGSPLLGAVSDTVNGRQKVNAAVSNSEYSIIEFDMSGISNWTDGYIDWLRIDILDTATVDHLGSPMAVDYVRAVNYETDVVEVTGIDVPVAKAVADADAVAKDTSKYTVVENGVSWEGGLLYGRYFGGSTEYTACVKVKGAPGFFVSDAPKKATVNGKDAEIGEYNYATGELTIKYTFPATGALETSEAYDLTLYGDPNKKPETVTIFKGDSFDLGSHMPESIPAGKRWIGWSESEEAEEGDVTGSIVVNEEQTYYAVFEDLVEFDYSNPYHRLGTTIKAGSGTLEYKNGLAVVTPNASNSDAAIITPVMNIDGSNFGFVEVYYSATIEATHEKLFYENIFSATLKPELKFSLVGAPDEFVYTGKLVSSERVLVGSHLFQKYVYDMSYTHEWSAWAGYVAKLCVDPYNGYPTWGLGLIKLVPSTEIDGSVNVDVAAPEAFGTPAGIEDVTISDNFEILDISWNGLGEGETFAPSTGYSVSVTLKPVSGFVVTDGLIRPTVNGESGNTIRMVGDSCIVTHEFPATEPLKDIEVVISGPDAITSRGRYIELNAETVALDGSELPVNSVTWSVESVGGVALAKINEKTGRVYPISNGTVIVTATSDYDPTVSATREITISNQAELVKVTFDKNTQANVTGMPEEVYVYGAFVPEQYSIKRDGFYFTGWSTNEDALEPDETFNITEDTVLYAKWGKGIAFNFNDASDAPPVVGKNVLVCDPKTGIGKLTYNNTTAAVGQVFNLEGLRAYKLDSSIYNKVEIRLSIPFASNLLMHFRGSDGVSDEGYPGGAYQYSGTATSKNDKGVFQTVTVDFSKVEKWTELPYLNRIRFDLVNNSIQGDIFYDYIRIPNYSRTVKFDANGGLVPYLDGEVVSYKQTYTVGNIPLPADPVREGYDFLGWAKVKEADETTKLYNNKFAVSDDVTLYAVWVPEGSAGEVEDNDGGYSSSDATTSVGGPSEHPGHATYPSLGGGSVSANPSYTTKTPTDKNVSVPERPKDDGPLAMGAGGILPEKFKLNTAYDGRFVDVKRSNWFYGDVEKSFRLGLMNGKSAYEFAPDGTVTVAEAITVAARMNATYYGRQVYGSTGAQWYLPYVEYAIANSIIAAGQFSDYKAPATREQVAVMFVKALPASWYPQKNMFSSIPDVTKGSDSEEVLLKLYNAGIFTGVDDVYNFKPAENIKRSELSAIINRVALPDSRLRVITEEEMLLKCKTFTAEDLIATKNIIVSNSVGGQFTNKNGGAYVEPAKADPWIGNLNKLFEDGIVNADEFKKITVVIKPDDPAAVVGAGGSKFYFAFDGKYTDAISVATKVPAAAEDGTITLVYDMSQHAMWKGEVTTLRYDPYDNATPFAIVSITFGP